MKAHTLDRLRSHIAPRSHAERILRAYVVHSPTPWSSRRHRILRSLGLTLYLADFYRQGRRHGWVRNPMKLRRSLCMARAVRENRWLYLFYKVNKDMLPLDRIHIPTRKFESRCRFWFVCEPVCVPIIQRVVLSLTPCSFGRINDSWVPIIQSNVLLRVNSERRYPRKEDRDEQEPVDDHVW
jgi:hypothetical protein